MRPQPIPEESQGTQAPEHAQERLELAAILTSRTLERSSTLIQLLIYLCSKYFEGTADQLKEYTIGVEALGRPQDFDPKKDSIVRVQAHRLREHLTEYYRAEGANHAVHIVIPPRSYTPRFVFQRIPASEVESPLPQLAITPVAPAVNMARTIRTPLFAVPVTVLCIAAILFAIVAHRQSNRTRRIEATLAAGAGSNLVRIVAGLDHDWIDGFGNTWQADRFFEGGSVVRLPEQPVLGTRDARIYQSRREGIFRYEIPLPPGSYELRLYFAETYYGETNTAGFGGEASREFDIVVNGKTLVQRLDVVGEVGASAADIKVFTDIRPAADGKLHLEFTPADGVPFLNAIEISRGGGERMRPIRLIERERGYTDIHGTYWQPDRYVVGGQFVQRRTRIDGTDDPELYRNKRFGNMTWTFPVAKGHRYGLTFMSSETWVGPGMPGGGGESSRMFDILCNGVLLERDFDIFRQTGGAKRALKRVFDNLTPDHQDKIVFSLKPHVNFPSVSALELLDETDVAAH
jgi:hypothetical protein